MSEPTEQERQFNRQQVAFIEGILNQKSNADAPDEIDLLCAKTRVHMRGLPL